MEQHNFMFCYKGKFTHQITKSILNITERKLVTENVEVSIKKKVFNVMVDCLQTICNKNLNDQYNRSSLIMIGKVNTDYIIYSGNIISNDDAISLQDKLTHINLMSKDDLRKMHYNSLSTLDLEKLGETGIGLVEIAKKSGNKLEFNFLTINEEHSYFVLRTLINKA